MFAAMMLLAGPAAPSLPRMVSPKPAPAPTPRPPTAPASHSRWANPRFRWTVLGVVGILLLSAAGGSVYFMFPTTPTKRVAVYMTDAPSGFDALDVKISGIYIGTSGYAIPLKAAQFDVLRYEGTAKALKVGEGKVPAGDYHQVSIVFVSASVTIHGQKIPLTIPHRMLKVTGGVDMLGPQSAVLLDVDVPNTIVSTEHGLEFHAAIKNAWTQDSTPAKESANGAMKDLSANGFTNAPTSSPPQKAVDPPGDLPASPDESTGTSQTSGGDSSGTDSTTDPTGGGNAQEGSFFPDSPSRGAGYDSRYCALNDQTANPIVHAATQGRPVDVDSFENTRKMACSANPSFDAAYDTATDKGLYLVRLVDSATGLRTEERIRMAENHQVPAPTQVKPVQEAAPTATVDATQVGALVHEKGSNLTAGSGALPTAFRVAPPDMRVGSMVSVDQKAAFANLAPPSQLKVLFQFANEPTLLVEATPKVIVDISKNDIVDWVTVANAPASYLSTAASYGTSVDHVAAMVDHAPQGAARHVRGDWVGIAMIDSGIDGTNDAIFVDATGTGVAPPGKVIVVAQSTAAAPTLSGVLPAGAMLPAMGTLIRTPTSDAAANDFGHGTFVAGILAAQAGHGGPEGLAPRSKLYSCSMGPLPTLGLATICLDQIVSFIDQGADELAPIKVVSLSIDVGDQDGAYLHSDFYHEISRLVARGVTVVVASGTVHEEDPVSGTQASTVTSLLCSTPVRGLICVGAVKPDIRPGLVGEEPRNFLSLFPKSARGLGAYVTGPWEGPWENVMQDPENPDDDLIAVDERTTWPDVCALGEDVRSTARGVGAANVWGTISGTSAATPQVAAAASLMISERLLHDPPLPPLAPWDIQQIIEDTAFQAPRVGPYIASPGDARYHMAGPLCGHGILDISAALDAALTYPSTWQG